MEATQLITAPLGRGTRVIVARIMKASMLYRIASILLKLFVADHNIGFPSNRPRLACRFRGHRRPLFNAGGFERSCFHLFVVVGLFVAALMVFAAIVAWQFGSLPAGTLAAMRVRAGAS